MNWEKLKATIYYWDGAWLDIYVHGTTAADWKKWIQFVNQKYRIEWHNENTGKNEFKVDFEVIQEFWNSTNDLCSTANIFIGDLQVNAHFFTVSEIENDIDPREFNSIEDHNRLIDYLKGVSLLLDKEVSVTPENCPEIELIKVKGDTVEIFTDSNPQDWPVRIKE